MTPIQEAYALMQEQPAGNIKLVIDLLHAMAPCAEQTQADGAARIFKRTGLAKETIELPEDFDENFDQMDKDIADLFYGGIL